MNRRHFCISATALSVFPMAFSSAVAATSALKVIKIGQSVALSGPVAGQVKAINSGAQLVFDRVNKSGGVQGRLIHLISLDDQLNPDKTVENCENLIGAHGVVALFGFAGSGNLMAVDPILRRTGVPVVGGIAVSDSVRAQTKETAYYVRAGYGREAERIVEQVTTLGLRRIGVVHFANTGGEEGKKLLIDELARRNLTLTAVAGVKVDGSNMSEAAAAMAEGKPQAVILFLGGTLPAKLISELEARGSFPSYYGMSIVPGETTAKELGNKLRGLVISQVMAYPWAGANPAIEEFRQLAAAAGVAVNYQSYEGYVTALVLVEALKRAANDISPAGIHAALKTMKSKLGGMDIDFTGNGNGKGNTGSKFVELVHITGSGRFTR